MEIFTSTVPQWVSILFLLIIPIPVLMIANIARQGAINAGFELQKPKQVFLYVLLFFAIYFCYVSTMSFTGLFQQNTLPPLIVLLTTLPLLIFFTLIVSNLKVYKKIIESLSLDAIVLVHVFRFIGIFFLILNAYGAIPTKFAYIAGFGDIATAVTSIFVAKAIKSKKRYAKKLTLAWNIFGILDIVSVLTAAIVTTKLSIETGSQDVLEITKFPFCLIPGFAPATILFLHFIVFKKLVKDRDRS